MTSLVREEATVRPFHIDIPQEDLDEQNQTFGTPRQPAGMITLFTMYLTTLGIAPHYVLTTLP